jgi:hypothetical protein
MKLDNLITSSPVCFTFAYKLAISFNQRWLPLPTTENGPRSRLEPSPTLYAPRASIHASHGAILSAIHADDLRLRRRQQHGRSFPAYAANAADAILPNAPATATSRISPSTSTRSNEKGIKQGGIVQIPRSASRYIRPPALDRCHSANWYTRTPQSFGGGNRYNQTSRKGDYDP